MSLCWRRPQNKEMSYAEREESRKHGLLFYALEGGSIAVSKARQRRGFRQEKRC